MKRRLFAAIVVAVILALSAPATVLAQNLDAGLAESRLFNVELGFLTGYRFEDEETVVGRAVAVNFSILENAQIGFLNAMFSDDAGGGQAYNMVRFDYFFTDRLSLSIGTGAEQQSASAAGLIGGNAILVRSIPDDGLATTLKAGVQYFSNDDDGFGDGTFALTLSGSIGL